MAMMEDPADDDYKRIDNTAAQDDVENHHKELEKSMAKQQAQNTLPVWFMAPQMISWLPFFLTYIVFFIRSLI